MSPPGLERELERRGREVGRYLESHIRLDEPTLQGASLHLLHAGGKRMRPALLLLAAEACGGSPRRLLPAAAAVELVHTFTLIHDDIMDQDTLRRGVPTVHTRYGLPAAILAGDTLYSKAFELLARSRAPSSRLAASSLRLAETCVEICEGQALDMAYENHHRVTEAHYIEMVRRKTASLIAASASLGGLLAGATPATVARLDACGTAMGIGFQISDDILGLTTTEKTLGKRRGNDLVRGKKTLVWLHATRRGFKPPRGDRASIERAIRQLENLGSIGYARQRAEEYRHRARRALAPLLGSRAKSLLLEFADYSVRRGH